MNLPSAHINEEQAATAFNKQSVIFDELYSGTLTSKVKS